MPTTEAEKYPVNEIMANCEKHLQVKPEILAGALYEETKTSFTMDEYRALIKNFLERRV